MTVRRHASAVANPGDYVACPVGGLTVLVARNQQLVVRQLREYLDAVS